MTHEHRLLVAAVLVLSGAVFVVSATSGEQHYAFLIFYVCVAVAAAWYGAWLGVATMLCVAVRRGLVIDGVEGTPLQLTSAVFAALVSLLVLWPLVKRRRAERCQED